MNEENIVNDSNVRHILKWTVISFGIIAVLCVFLYLVRLFFKGPHYKKNNRIDGKIVIITGCNTGIGKETALELAKRGGKIYMACRNREQCENARQEIIKLTGNQNVFNRTLDLASLESIREFVKGFLKEESHLDILINNAGCVLPNRQLTLDGFEMHIGVNHLGHFLLTNLLLDALKASKSGRIVVLASALYFLGLIRKNDLMYERRYFIGVLAYSTSKLANILFTTTLARKLQGTTVTVNCLHPGVVKTDLFRNYLSNGWKKLLELPFYIFLKDIKDGAQTTIRLALDPNLENVSGNYYFDTYYRLPLLPKANNKEMGEWLWQESEKLTNLNNF